MLLPMNVRLPITLSLAALLVTACGGGNSEAPPTTTPSKKSAGPERIVPGGGAPVDAAAWLEAHGVAREEGENLGSCGEVKVSPAKTDALACLGGPAIAGSLPRGDSVYGLRVLVVENGALKPVLSVPGAAAVVNILTTSVAANPQYYAALDLEVEPSGARLKVKDSKHLGCDEAQKERDEAVRSDPSLAGAFEPRERVLRRMCAVRGSYVWRDGAFVPENG